MKPLLKFLRLSPRSMPDAHGNDNEAARLRRVVEIRNLLAEIAVESPCREYSLDQDNGRKDKACVV